MASVHPRFTPEFLRKRDNLWDKVGYQPHSHQVPFHESRARFKVAMCGRRFGKSRMASAEALPYLFDRGVDGMGTKTWIVGPTYKSAAKEFEYIYNDVVRGPFRDLGGVRSAFNVRTGEMYVKMPWGSTVEVRSAEKPSSLVGEGLDFLIISEAAKVHREIWEKYLRPALADRHAPAIFPSTPEGQNFFYELFVLGQPGSGQCIHDESTYPEGDPKREMCEWESWEFPSWKNLIVYPGGFEDPEIQSQMRSPDDPVFWQEVGANPRSFAGAIYREFDQAKHVKPHVFNPAWPNYMFLDFGFRNKWVALDVQVGPDDRVYVWREYTATEKPTFQCIDELLTRENPPGYHVVAAVGDCADASSVAQVSERIATCSALPEAKKDWLQGVQVTKEFLQERIVDRDDSTNPPTLIRAPGLTIDPSCTNLIFEFPNYRVKQQGTRGAAEDGKEAPQKRNDHSLDALRYGLVTLFGLGMRDSLAEAVQTTSDTRAATPAFAMSTLEALEPMHPRSGEDDTVFQLDRLSF